MKQKTSLLAKEKPISKRDYLRKMKATLKELTYVEALCLIHIKNGADIYAYDLAKILRGIHERSPKLITITTPKMYTGDGTDQVPYFGAIATKTGLKEARKVLGL